MPLCSPAHGAMFNAVEVVLISCVRDAYVVRYWYVLVAGGWFRVRPLYYSHVGCTDGRRPPYELLACVCECDGVENVRSNLLGVNYNVVELFVSTSRC